MFSKTLTKFKSLPKETRSMVFLYWVYECAEMLLGIFLSIFVYLQTQSLTTLVIYNALYFTGTCVGFCVWGYAMAQFQISMKYNYLRSFLIYILSFGILIFFEHTITNLLIFGFTSGMGLGMFWVGVHSYEMIYTHDKNRDFYSSMVSAGTQTFAVLAPFIATLSFIISEKVLHVETFTILFITIPFVYLFSLPIIFSLPDYVPEKISKQEIKRLVFDKKISKARHYYIASAFDWAIWSVCFPIIAIQSLGTVINVGILETVAGVLSLFAVIFLSHKRHEGNRLKIFLYSITWAAVANAIVFFWELNPALYIVYTLMIIFIDPIFRVSEHVIDLKSIEIIREKEGASFYGGLIYRDFILWCGRITGILMIGIFGHFFGTNNGVRIGLIILTTFYFLIWWTAKRMIEGEKLPEHGFAAEIEDIQH